MNDKFEGLPEERRRGLERMEQVYGFEMSDGDGDFFRYTADHLFADIWNRPGLTDRDRRLLLDRDARHPRGPGRARPAGPGRFANGELDAEALREIVVFVAHYAGWPVAARLNSIVEETIARGVVLGQDVIRTGRLRASMTSAQRHANRGLPPSVQSMCRPGTRSRPLPQLVRRDRGRDVVADEGRDREGVEHLVEAEPGRETGPAS